MREWETSRDLRAEVALSLPQTIKARPAFGWIRGNVAASAEVLAENINLRQENASLIKEITKLKSTPMFDDLAGGADTFEIVFIGIGRSGYDREYLKKAFTWDEIFSIVGPKSMARRRQAVIKNDVDEAMKEIIAPGYQFFWVRDQDFETIGLQLSAMRSLSITSHLAEKDEEEFWQITEEGRRYLHEVRTIRKNSPGIAAAK